MDSKVETVAILKAMKSISIILSRIDKKKDVLSALPSGVYNQLERKNLNSLKQQRLRSKNRL